MSTTINATTPAWTPSQQAAITSVKEMRLAPAKEKAVLALLMASFKPENTSQTDTRSLTGGIKFQVTDTGSTLTLQGGAVVKVSSDSAAPAVQTTLPGGTSVATQYDADGKPAGATVTLPGGDVVTTSTTNGVAMTTIQHGKDAPVTLSPGTSQTLPGGATVTVGLDGKATIGLKDGTKIVTEVDGKTSTTLGKKVGDGDAITTIQDDGTVSTLSATGTETSTTPDGVQQNTATVKKFADGSFVSQGTTSGIVSRTLSENGPKITSYPPGDDNQSQIVIDLPLGEKRTGVSISTSFDSADANNPIPVGTVITVADGTIGGAAVHGTQITIADGHAQYYNDDNLLVNVVPGAPETTLKNGTKISMDKFGNTTVTLGDGTRNVISKSGDRDTTLPDGTTKIHLKGDVEAVDAKDPTLFNDISIDGTLLATATTTKLADSSTLLTTSDGLFIRTLPDGKKIMCAPASATNPVQMSALTLAPPNDGYSVFTSADKTTYVGLPDGSRIQPVAAQPATDKTPATPGGFVIISPDGTASGVLSSGSINGVKYDFNGEKYSVTLPDGSVVNTDMAGVTTTIAPDKTTIFNADGTVQEKVDDNSNQIRDINGDVIDTSTIDRSVTGAVTETWQKKLKRTATYDLAGAVFDVDTKTKASTVTFNDHIRLITSGAGDSGVVVLPDGGSIQLSENGWIFVSADGKQTALVGAEDKDGKPVAKPSTVTDIDGLSITATDTGGLTVKLPSGAVLNLQSGGTAPKVALPDGSPTGKLLTYDGLPTA